MTTVHCPSDFEAYDLVSKTKRHGIPAESAITRVKTPSYILPSVYVHSQPHIEQGIPFPTAIQQYNQHMGESDSNAQVRAYYSPETWSFRYWWPLFKYLLDASILNAYTLWKLRFPASKLSHVDFQHQVAMSLVQDPAGTDRKRATNVEVTGLEGLKDLEHDWAQLKKRAYCQVCQLNGDRPSKKPRPLAETTNSVTNKRRQRGPQTLWGCKGCMGSACCRGSSCWEALHS